MDIMVPRARCDGLIEYKNWIAKRLRHEYISIWLPFSVITFESFASPHTTKYCVQFLCTVHSMRVQCTFKAYSQPTFVLSIPTKKSTTKKKIGERLAATLQRVSFNLQPTKLHFMFLLFCQPINRCNNVQFECIFVAAALNSSSHWIYDFDSLT